MPIEQLMPLIENWLKSAGLWRAQFDADLQSWLPQAMDLIRGRVNTLNDFITFGQAYISDKFEMDSKAVRKHLDDPEVARWMPELAVEMDRLDDFESATVESALRRFLKIKEIKPGKLMNAVRTAVTGQAVGPDFLKILTLLGQRRVVERLKAAVNS